MISGKKLVKYYSEARGLCFYFLYCYNLTNFMKGNWLLQKRRSAIRVRHWYSCRLGKDRRARNNKL
jgi:hypothetical protein